MSTRKIDAASIRAYVARDWMGARQAKQAYWRERLARGGLREALRITADLRDSMMQLVPDWPTERDREEDLETHRRVTQTLKKASVSQTRATSLRARTRRVR